jgi:hypothetical protein
LIWQNLHDCPAEMPFGLKNPLAMPLKSVHRWLRRHTHWPMLNQS